MVDLMLYWGIYLRYQQLRGRIVICDRYLDDTRLDFRRNFPTVAFERSRLWRLLAWITPRPDVSFLLWIPVAVSLQRSQEKGEPFPDDEQTLAWRLESYMDESVFPAEDYIRLDCRLPVETVAAEIAAMVSSLPAVAGHADAS
jgi:thymidylate kinase